MERKNNESTSWQDGAQEGLSDSFGWALLRSCPPFFSQLTGSHLRPAPADKASICSCPRHKLMGSIVIMQIRALSSKSLPWISILLGVGASKEEKREERADDEREPWAPREATLANRSPPSPGNPAPPRLHWQRSAPKPGIRWDVLADGAGSSLGIESGPLQEKRRAPSLPTEFWTTYPFLAGLTACFESSRFHNMLGHVGDSGVNWILPHPQEPRGTENSESNQVKEISLPT